MDPPNLVTNSLVNLFSTYPSSTTSPAPKVVTLTSIGLTPREHAKLPLLLKPLYGAFLAAPHEDKLGAERVVVEAAKKTWPAEDPEPKSGILPEGYAERLAATGVAWNDVVVVRPALLTDGACRAEEAPAGKLPYRFSEDGVKGGYRMSRKDVAHFIVEVLLSDWEQFKGKAVSLAY